MRAIGCKGGADFSSVLMALLESQTTRICCVQIMLLCSALPSSKPSGTNNTTVIPSIATELSSNRNNCSLWIELHESVQGLWTE